MDSQLIYDVGMNNGDDTAYYLWRGFRVVAVEADPALVELARQRFAAEIAQGRLTICGVGIAAEEGEAEFWVSDEQSVWSSFNKAAAGRGDLPLHSVKIRCVRFGRLLAEHGVPLFLKIDIEGNDIHCLRDLNRGDLPRWVST